MYSDFRSVIRYLYDACGEYLEALYEFIKFIFQPLNVSLTQLSLDPTGITGNILDAINWFSNNALGEMSLAGLMLGAGITAYFGFTLVKWVLDIIF